MATVGTAVITGTLFWPCLGKKNTMKDKYTVDVGHLDDVTVAKLQALGVGAKIKTDQPKPGYVSKGDKFVHETDRENNPDRDDRKRYIVVQSNFPVSVEDNKRNKVDPNTVGAGSVGQVRVTAFEWSFQGKKGTAADGTLGAGFNHVVINQLNTYAGFDSDTADFDYEEPDETKEKDIVEAKKDPLPWESNDGSKDELQYEDA